jgi:hypothetical protein
MTATQTRARRAHGKIVRAVDRRGLHFAPMTVARHAADPDDGRALLLCPFELLALAMTLDYARWANCRPGSRPVTPAESIVPDFLYEVSCPLVRGRTVKLDGYGLIEDAECALGILAADPAATDRLATAGYRIERGGVVYRPEE